MKIKQIIQEGWWDDFTGKTAQVEKAKARIPELENQIKLLQNQIVSNQEQLEQRQKEIDYLENLPESSMTIAQRKLLAHLEDIVNRLSNRYLTDRYRVNWFPSIEYCRDKIQSAKDEIEQINKFLRGERPFNTYGIPVVMNSNYASGITQLNSELSQKS